MYVLKSYVHEVLSVILDKSQGQKDFSQEVSIKTSVKKSLSRLQSRSLSVKNTHQLLESQGFISCWRDKFFECLFKIKESSKTEQDSNRESVKRRKTEKPHPLSLAGEGGRSFFIFLYTRIRHESYTAQVG
jgi:hypothetical protein